MAKRVWITPIEYADRVGKSARQINRSIVRGSITRKSLKKRGKRFLIDPEKADQDLKENLSYINQKPLKTDNKKEHKKTPTNTEIKSKTKVAGTSGMSHADAQRVQARLKAALMKLEYDEKSGLLVKKEQVDIDFFNCARRARDAILNIPGKVSAELAAITDIHVVSQKLTTELTAALEELSQ